MKYGSINKFVAQPGKAKELTAILLQAAEALQTNEDCLQYIIGTTDEPETIYVTEIWTSKRAHVASLEPPEVKAIVAQAMPLIASVANVAEQQITGGKGLKPAA